MEQINIQWLTFFGIAAAWTTFFSMFNTPGIRGWRNLGWLACYILAIVMLVLIPWRSALATWATIGVFSGIVYFAYELVMYFKSKGSPNACSFPKISTIVNGLYVWPIMLPEAIEYSLAEVGLLKAPSVPRQNEEQ